jgi:hypothetical protein
MINMTGDGGDDVLASPPPEPHNDFMSMTKR